MPVLVLVSVTLASTTTPPDWSVTVPRRDALVWPNVAPPRRVNTARRNTAKKNPWRILTAHLHSYVLHAQNTRRREIVRTAVDGECAGLRIAPDQMAPC